MRILYIQAGFKTFRLIMIIFMITYFIGMFFFIFSELMKDLDSKLSNGENFIDYFKLEDKNHYQIVVTMCYFAFTSLSTVGFGDYHPRSNSERILTAFILLFGVAIFSYILGQFSEILISFNKLNASIDEGDELTKFFGLLKQFNYNKDMTPKFKQQVEDFFQYKWNHDCNLSVSTEDDHKLFDQLPNNVQGSIYSEFLFKKFLQKFIKFFTFPNLECKMQHAYFGWQHDNYMNFMIYFLQLLEPIKLNKNQVIFTELENVNMVVFTIEGGFDIGYEINK